MKPLVLNQINKNKQIVFQSSGQFYLVLSTPVDIKLCAKGAAIDVMPIEPNGGRTETYSKYKFISYTHETGVELLNEKQGQCHDP